MESGSQAGENQTALIQPFLKATRHPPPLTTRVRASTTSISPRVHDVMRPLVHPSHDHVGAEDGECQREGQQQPEYARGRNRPANDQVGGVDAHVVKGSVVVTVVDVVPQPILGNNKR